MKGSAPYEEPILSGKYADHIGNDLREVVANPGYKED